MSHDTDLHRKVFMMGMPAKSGGFNEFMDSLNPYGVTTARRELVLLESDVSDTDDQLRRKAYQNATPLSAADSLTNWWANGEWRDFKNNWNGFLTRYKPGWELGDSTTVFNSVQDFRAKLIDLRKKANGLGIQFVGSVPREPKEKEESVVKVARDIGKNVIIGIAIIAGIVIVPKVLDAWRK